MLKTKKFWYILLFSILYLIVAGSSFWHAIAFFGLANNTVMSIILAFAFEVGQAAVLFSLLTSKKDRNRVIPWALMTMFTLVQVIGNVYSSYKYIISNSVADLRYFKEPIFIWTQLPDDQATVIITYVVGAILPIAALLLTSMITNYLTDEEEAKLENKKLIDEQNEEKLQEVIEEAPETTFIEEQPEQEEETFFGKIPEKGPKQPPIIMEPEQVKEFYETEKLPEEKKEEPKYDSVDEAIEHAHDNETGLTGIENKIKEEESSLDNDPAVIDRQVNENNIDREDTDKTIKEDDPNLKQADMLMGGNILSKNHRDSHFINIDNK